MAESVHFIFLSPCYNRIGERDTRETHIHNSRGSNWPVKSVYGSIRLHTARGSFQSRPDVKLSSRHKSPQIIYWMPSTWKYWECDYCFVKIARRLPSIMLRLLCYCATACSMKYMWAPGYRLNRGIDIVPRTSYHSPRSCCYVPMCVWCVWFDICTLFSGTYGSFPALAAGGHTGRRSVRHGASLGSGRAPWHVLWVFKVTISGM